MRGIVGFTVFYLALTCITAEKKIVCYFANWAVYRPGNGKFEIGDIDPSLCTHLIYAFVGLDGNKVSNLDAWQDLPTNWGKDGFGRFNALREKNPTLKTLVAIGGWKEGSENYSKMASEASSRTKFVENVVAFVKKWKFDGFDLDWEYPAQRGGDKSDVAKHVELVKLMRKRFEEEGLILSAAVAAAESSASKSYNIQEMSKYLHFINLMAYDLHGAWESQTGINAPLYPSKNEAQSSKGLNVEASVKYWLSQGAPKEKLILGVPSYGRAFTLKDPKSNGIGAATKGPGIAGPYTQEPGMLGYNEICEKFQNEEDPWSVFFDEEGRVPYAFKGDQWVGFDNIISLKEKAEFAKKYDLGGAMVWSIETDDFRGICGQKYPVLKTLNAVLRGGFSVPSESDLTTTPLATTPSPSTSKPSQPTTSKPSQPTTSKPSQPTTSKPFQPTKPTVVTSAPPPGFPKHEETVNTSNPPPPIPNKLLVDIITYYDDQSLEFPLVSSQSKSTANLISCLFLILVSLNLI